MIGQICGSIAVIGWCWLQSWICVNVEIMSLVYQSSDLGLMSSALSSVVYWLFSLPHLPRLSLTSSTCNLRRRLHVACFLFSSVQCHLLHHLAETSHSVQPVEEEEEQKEVEMEAVLLLWGWRQNEEQRKTNGNNISGRAEQEKATAHVLLPLSLIGQHVHHMTPSNFPLCDE